MIAFLRSHRYPPHSLSYFIFSTPSNFNWLIYCFILTNLYWTNQNKMNNRYNITYFCLIYTRNVDFEWYPWTLENWRHCLGLKLLYILYNIIIISFGMRFSAFELHSVVVHVLVLVLFLKKVYSESKYDKYVVTVQPSNLKSYHCDQLNH